ncbi:MAG TPA: EamA family transporter [Clostridia bacterium]|nr:EamA family transporter [Clostridia bacterium]
MKAYVFALLTALFWGLGPVFGKIGLYKVEPLTGLTARTVAVALVLLPYAVASGKMSGLAQMETQSLVFLIAEGIFASLLGHLAYYYALKYGEAASLVPVTAAYPLVTVAVAGLLLGEQLTWTKVVGALLIVAGILVIKQ